MIDTGDIDFFLGLDADKGEHHATAVTPAGKKAFDKRLPNPTQLRGQQQPVGRSHAECGTQLSTLSQEVAAFGGVDLFKPVPFD